MYRFLQVLLLLFMGNRIINRFRSQPSTVGALNAAVAKSKDRYSMKSERLWEPGILNPNYRIRYRSEWTNKNGDPVFYRNGDEPWLVSPVIYPKVHGSYRANPGGLNIDENTGQIDVNNSDTGISYEVEFMPCGKRGVARTQVVMAGVSFPGGILSLSSDQPLIARPHYYGHNPELDVPSEIAPTGRYGYIPENVKPSANLRGLFIDERTGEIDLRKTIASGALGFRQDGTQLPVSGTTKEFRVYYQLDTSPNREVLNYTAVRVHFFDTEDDIPDELLARLRQTHNSIFQKMLVLPLVLAMPYAWWTEAPWEALAALMAALSSLLFLNAHESNHPLRPPEQVIIK
jgi:hypothetical protein